MVASRPESGPDAAVAAIRKARPDLYAFSNDEVIERFSASGSRTSGRSPPRCHVTLFFGFLLITVLLTVSVNQRLGEIAALRAHRLLAPRVAADVLWESVLLVGIGGAAGAAARPGAVALARRHPASDARRARRPCTSSSSSRGRSWLHAALLAGAALRRRALPDVAGRAPADRRDAAARGGVVTRPTRRSSRRAACRAIFPMAAGPVTALRDVSLADRRGRVRGDCRAVGLRQVDAAARARLRGHADQRRGLRSRGATSGRCPTPSAAASGWRRSASCSSASSCCRC